VAISNYDVEVYATSSAWDQRGNSTDKLDSNSGKTLVRKIQDAWIAWHNACSINLALDNATLVGGTGYPDGTYTDIELSSEFLLNSGGSQYGGRELYATVTVASGIVTAVTLTQKNGGFIDGEKLIFVNNELDGTTTGSGFSINVATGSNVESRPINCGDAKRVARDGSWTSGLGWTLGARRQTNIYSDVGQVSFFGWTGNESTTFYTYNVLNKGISRTNNGLIPSNSYMTGNAGAITNTWSDTSVYIIYIYWCADEGKESFFVTDSQYKDMTGFMRVDTTYGSCNDLYAGDWLVFSDRDTHPMMNVSSSTSPLNWGIQATVVDMTFNGAIKPMPFAETDNFIVGYPSEDYGRTAWSVTLNQTLEAAEGSIWTQVFPYIAIKTTDAP